MKEELFILKRGNHLALSKLYEDYRSYFMQFAKKFNLDPDTLADIYQDSFIALREHALKGNLDHLKSAIKTYLTSIGKYMIYERLKTSKSKIAYENIAPKQDESVEYKLLEEDELSSEQVALRVHFKKLGKRCQEMLTLFYYRGLTIEEITDSLGYENKNVVKSQKSRCLKSLKDLIKNPL
ncbi:RNA polymerase sigma factor [Aquimarina brevivitae]|uniref:RNA polymerase sigma factor (Sigma-70 family) n=1 Tax=Aquimarina brevivitae TaxID=323412 RepID=A0A4Q7PEY4_9FLAO|nr:RNA polymerase sigma factor [Aquimarina brevivitae]RZS99001.1 RNA polymerase sigma factor (sigma-70 family) [Aquimarina brevivitae]